MEGASVKLNGCYTIWQKLSEKIEVDRREKDCVLVITSSLELVK